MMRRVGFATGRFAALLIVVSAAACTQKTPPQLSPAGAAGYHGYRVLQAVAAIQDTTIMGERNGVIPAKDARIVVQATGIAGKAGSELANALRVGNAATDAKTRALGIIRQALLDVPGQLSPETQKLLEPYFSVALSAISILE